jgi:hypothetical protein
MFNLLKICLYIYTLTLLKKKNYLAPPIKMSGSVPNFHA